MANVKFLTTDRAASASWSTDSEAATLPIENLAGESRRKVWRSTATGTTGAYAQADLGSALSVDVVALLNVNWTTGATVGIKSSANSDMSSPDLNVSLSSSGLTPYLDTTSKQFVYPLSSTSTRRYWRVTVTDTSLSYIEAGKMILGPVTVPTRNFSPEWSEFSEDRSIISESVGGDTFVNLRTVKRGVELELKSLTEGEATGFARTLMVTHGRSKPFLTVLSHDATAYARDSIWGLLQADPEIAYSSGVLRTLRLRILERH